MGYCPNFIFLGDFNVNYDNPSYPLYNSLCNLVSLYSLTNISYIQVLYMCRDGSTFTIDLAFTSNPALRATVRLCPLDNSDHYGVLLELKKKADKAEKARAV